MTARVILQPAQEVLSLGMSESFAILRRALEAAKLAGRYTLAGVKYGHAAHPKLVQALSVGAACKEGVTLFFPDPEKKDGIPARLLIEKAGGAPIYSPIDFGRRLADALASLDAEEDDAPPVASPPSVAPGLQPVEDSNVVPLRTGQILVEGRKRRLEAKLEAIFADKRRLRSFASSVAALIRSTERGIVTRKEITERARRFWRTRDYLVLNRVVLHLITEGHIVTTWSEKNRMDDRCPYRLPESGPAPTAPPSSGTSQAGDDSGSPVESITRLIRRRDELRPYHEEFLLIEAQLAKIKGLL